MGEPSAQAAGDSGFTIVRREKHYGVQVKPVVLCLLELILFSSLLVRLKPICVWIIAENYFVFGALENR